MQVPVYNIGGEVIRNIEISDAVFAIPFNEALIKGFVADLPFNLTEAQRNEVLHAINGQKQAALSLHKVLQSLK